MTKVPLWISIVVAFGIAVAAANWPEVRFAKLEASELGSRLAALVLFSLLIERTVEVFLTIWRAEDAYKKEATVQRLVSVGTLATDPVLVEARTRLIDYKAQTQRWALPSGFILGVLIASLGVRILQQFIAPFPPVGDPNRPTETQIWWFHVADIVLTGAMLAGGADPIHKLMDAFRKFMEASSAKASGTAN